MNGTKKFFFFDIFVNHLEIQSEGFRSLAEGDMVEFEIVEGDKGYKTADKVKSYKDFIPFEINIDPGDASNETIQEFLEALNDYYLASGGIGIEYKIDDDDHLNKEAKE